MNERWYKLTKSYKGGRGEFQIRVPAARLNKDDWECIFEWIGEHTDGGHAYGYSINATRLRRQSKTLKVVRYPSGVCAATYGKGEDVTRVENLI